LSTISVLRNEAADLVESVVVNLESEEAVPSEPDAAILNYDNGSQDRSGIDYRSYQRNYLGK
jgi:hypothetical protein